MLRVPMAAVSSQQISLSYRYFCCFLHLHAQKGGVRNGSFAGVERHSPSDLPDAVTICLAVLFIIYVSQKRNSEETEVEEKCWDASVGLALEGEATKGTCY